MLPVNTLRRQDILMTDVIRGNRRNGLHYSNITPMEAQIKSASIGVINLHIVSHREAMTNANGELRLNHSCSAYKGFSCSILRSAPPCPHQRHFISKSFSSRLGYTSFNGEKSVAGLPASRMYVSLESPASGDRSVTWLFSM